MKKLKEVGLMLLAAVAFAACEKDIDQPTSGDPVGKNAGGGNIDCAELDVSYEFSSDRVSVDETDGMFSFDGEFPDGFTVTLNDGAASMSWSYEDPAGLLCIDAIAVVVKGGPAAEVYYYDSSDGFVTGGEGLTAPDNPNNAFNYNVSNVTLCYSLVSCDGVCYDDETAWADGPRYTTKGNWATYTPYAEGDVTLFAGRTNDAGTVSFSAEVDGMVTITIGLDNGYFLNPNVEEPVKIQGYGSAPSGNPAPGLFTTYKGSSLEVTVPAFDFYGIHLDTQIEVPCPEDE